MILLAIFLLVVSVVAFNILSQTFYTEDEDLALQLDIPKSGINIDYTVINGDSIRYTSYVDADLLRPAIIMLHGAPGSCGDFNRYMLNLELQESFDLYSFERAGYGPTVDREGEYSIRKQADIAIAMIDQLIQDTVPIALMSHSYGGPVAALIAANIPDRCIGHIMIAPVIDPYSEEVFWYSSIPLLWPFKLFASAPFKRASREKLGHREELLALKDMWSTVHSPTIHFHGDKDWLASIDNVAFCEQMFPSDSYRPVQIQEGSHFILWEEEIEKQIINETMKLGSLSH